MQMITQNDNLEGKGHDLVVLGVFAGEHTDKALAGLDAALGGGLAATCADHDFTGKPKQQVVLSTLGKLPARRVALVGLGARSEQGAATWVRLGGTASKLANSVGAKSVLVAPPTDSGEPGALAALLGRGVALGTYRYDVYKSDKGRAASLKKVAFDLPGDAAVKAALADAEVVADAVALARDLVNDPPRDLYPESFAKKASDAAKEVGLSCQVFGAAELQKRKMGLLMAVGQGSEHGPRLVHLSYRPGGQGKGKAKPKGTGKGAGEAPVVLVGKGITFDSGGLCIKPPDGMLTMKCDMAGAAAVLATLVAVARLELPIAVDGILALAENMPSGNAFRMGDVITGASGKTVEITNTDAEGRLVLADALHYAVNLGARSIVDLATLTGACMVALGPQTAGLFSNNDDVAAGLLAAAGVAGEELWRMPLVPALRDNLKSEIADMRNAGDRLGGAITAALFLKEFVGDKPWAHMDIAGPAFTSDESGALSKGGTGYAVPTLVAWLSAQAG
jgi:leucyl aminopeptidase